MQPTIFQVQVLRQMISSLCDLLTRIDNSILWTGSSVGGKQSRQQSSGCPYKMMYMKYVKLYQDQSCGMIHIPPEISLGISSRHVACAEA